MKTALFVGFVFFCSIWSIGKLGYDKMKTIRVLVVFRIRACRTGMAEVIALRYSVSVVLSASGKFQEPV